MAKTVSSPQEQIASVHRALKQVEGWLPFRGQEDLLGDLREQLERLREAHARGELEPIVYTRGPATGEWVALAALIAGALRLMVVLF